MIFTARKISASVAFEWGILTRVVKREEMMNVCVEFANEMLKNGPIALRQAKFSISQGVNVDLQTGLALSQKHMK